MPSDFGIPQDDGPAILRDKFDIAQCSAQQLVSLRWIHRAEANIAAVGANPARFFLRKQAYRGNSGLEQAFDELPISQDAGRYIERGVEVLLNHQPGDLVKVFLAVTFVVRPRELDCFELQFRE